MPGLDDDLRRRRTVKTKGIPPALKDDARAKLIANSSVDWADYFRRVALREQRRCEIRRQAGWHGIDPATRWLNQALDLYHTYKKGA